MSIQRYQIPDTEEFLDFVWMANGLPAFFADRDDICDVVESIGFNIYYLIANHTVTKTTPSTNKGVTTNTTHTTSNAQLFKVVNNIVGRTVSKSNESFQENETIDIQESAVYNMPAIPLAMVDKLDQFFRLVDAQHGTESIVLLTYDTTKEGPEGWGILVPDQTNTSVHCNYDPASVLEHKPDDALIVGSVHSHPGMAAYASGTDHNDQADFDGIHITFGWQKSVNNGATQYHCEMQMAGTAYTLRVEDVFEDYVINKEPDPEVVGWTDKVKKALPPSHSAGVMSAPRAHQTPPPHLSQPVTTQAGTHKTGVTQQSRFDEFPEIWRNLGKESIVVGLVTINSKNKAHCPACTSSVSDYDIEDGWCGCCTMPIIDEKKLKENTFDDIFSDLAYWCYQFNYPLEVKPYLWTKEDGKNVVTPMSNRTLQEEIKYEADSTTVVPLAGSDLDYIHIDDEVESDLDYMLSRRNSGAYLLCCGLPEERKRECFCPNTIEMSDLINFDEYTKKFNIYVNTTDCYSCHNFYDIKCPSYRNLLEIFVEDRTVPAEEYAQKIDGEGCPMYLHYSLTEPYAATSHSLYTDYD